MQTFELKGKLRDHEGRRASKDARTGEVFVHFPRIGFILKKVDA